MLAEHERFLRLVSPCPNSGCWFWSGAVGVNGYGRFWRDGQNVPAHRTAYEFFVGCIPTGMHICHRCDVRSCVNPDHLFAGTNQDNIADRVRKGRSSRNGGSPPGSNNPTLSPSDIPTIRALVAAGNSRRHVARQYGVTHEVVRRIVNRTAWRHIP